MRRLLILCFLSTVCHLASQDVCDVNQIFITETQNNAIELRERVTIPVVFHLLLHSGFDGVELAVLKNKLNELSLGLNAELNQHRTPEIFKPYTGALDISFCLAQTTPDGEPFKGYTETTVLTSNILNTTFYYQTNLGGQDAWDTSKYLNIWIGESDGFNGRSTLPDVAGQSHDGILLSSILYRETFAKYLYPNVLIHEFGHYLGLNHIWGITDPNCIADDGISDTPLQYTSTNTCPPNPNIISCGSLDMYCNFMDYTPEYCTTMFTKEQCQVMLSNLYTYRSELIESSNCLEPKVAFTEVIPFRIYPNVVDSKMALTFDEVVYGSLVVKIIDMAGREVYRHGEVVYQRNNLYLGFLPPGLYYVQINDWLSKFVKI